MFIKERLYLDGCQSRHNAVSHHISNHNPQVLVINLIDDEKISRNLIAGLK